jgi:carbonic anhydrase/acetyltransferase-like protein (isoleucine patch superfamily)
VGDVTLAEDVSIWYGAVLRGDSGAITVGAGTNIQDNCVLHEKTAIGENCTIGHGAIVHGCAIGDRCMIGMGAIVLNGAVIGDDCLVGAGALVTGKMNAPAGSVLLGNPAKIVKEITPAQMEEIRLDAENYIRLAQSQQ